MTTAEKKKLLVIACTCDRLEWQLQRRRSQRAAMTSSPLMMAIDPLLSWVTPWLPRWARVGTALTRMWLRR